MVYSSKTEQHLKFLKGGWNDQKGKKLLLEPEQMEHGTASLTMNSKTEKRTLYFYISID